ncbi:hypothetical protein [Falsirhodobacter halotolerans]|uniref:hypothetical protein n=1 Tax=Falsirhodobacter halotolerans TaxID=1146892 RepID=UPI001FD15733|nr:hypothetical protein [Falsirhodobacter halotolerans]MCJ8140508.1 hypothetical protein [Falsirhodobacter halotolerans]
MLRSDPSRPGPRPGSEGPLPEVGGILGGVLWCGAVIGWWLTRPEGQGPGILMVLLLLVVPLALIAGLVTTLRAMADLRAEAEELRLALDGARTAPPVAHTTAPRPATARPAARPPEPDQSEMFDEPPAPEPAPDLTMDDYLRALNFPESEEDAAGIDALRRVLADPDAARLLRAAQDVLTLLAEDRIYLDEVASDAPRADLWRRFAHGERGRSMAGVGTIRDRAALSAAAARMREDQIFRDAAHHFMRGFDRSLPAFGQFATDGELEALAQTRSARAFLLLAQAAGAFSADAPTDAPS